MNCSLPAALAICLAVGAPATAAPKKKEPSTPPTVPPTSKMIAMPPADPNSGKGGEPPKLISSEMSGQDLQFFTTVVEAGRTQVFLIEMLKTKGQTAKMKALAEALSDTQAQENKQVARLAAAKGWNVSVEPTAVQTKLGAQLEKQAGADLDKAVMEKVASATKESVAAYEAAAQLPDKDVKAFAEQMLPLEREKLQLVEKMTGAGQSANHLLRTGPSSQPAPVATPKAEGVGGATPPPAIIPSKPKATATPAVIKQATIPAGDAPATPVPAKN